MIARHLFCLLLVAFLPTIVVIAADDPYGDPIPEGARLRLGTARMRLGYTSNPAALSADGKSLVGTGPSGGVVYVDPATGKTTRTIQFEGGGFGSIAAFSANGGRGVAVGYQEVFIREMETGKVLTRLKRPVPGSENAVALSGDGKRLAVGGQRPEKEKTTSAVIWDVDGDKQIATVTPVQNQTVYVALARDGKRLATWGYYYDPNAKNPPDAANDPNRQIQFWDATDGKELAKVRLPNGFTPAAVVFAPNGSLVATSAGDGTIHLLDPATGAAKGLLLGRSRQGRKLAFSPDGKTLASCGDDGSVQRWTVADGKRIGTTEPPVATSYGPRAIQFTDNERAVVWGSRGSVTIVWEIPSGKLISPVGGHFTGISGVAAAGGGKEFFTAGTDGMIIRWDPATGKELGTLALRIPGSALGTGIVSSSVILSHDGTRALGADGSAGGLGVYDLPAGTQQFVIPGDVNRESRGTFTPDGTKVVQLMSAYDAKKNPARVAVWDAVGAMKLGELELPGIGQVAAALTPDGKTLITAGTKINEKGPGEFVVTGWDLATGKKLGEFTADGGSGSTYVAAIGDNKSAVIVTPKGTVVVIDVVAGKQVRELETGTHRPALAPVMSPDMKSVAIAMAPNFGATPAATILVLDVENGKVLKTFLGPNGAPGAVAFSPDGKTLLTGWHDTTVLVWDVAGK